MQASFGKNLLGYGLLIYAFGCLTLAVSLSQHLRFSINPEDFHISELLSETRLPEFTAIEQTPERKQAFLELLLPLVEEKNRAVLKNRNLILKMREQLQSGEDLSERQYDLLERLRERYKVSHEVYPDTAKAIEILLLRADMLPSAMVLAQAAIESGWGTSRFAVEAHNLFGQWCYTPGCGLVPEHRPRGTRHEVQKFNSVEESLNAYYININTHSAYRELRQLRAHLRDQDGGLTGSELVAALGRYSGRGQDYINELRTVIRVNSLENLDSSSIRVAVNEEPATQD
jgi:Bax protein